MHKIGTRLTHRNLSEREFVNAVDDMEVIELWRATMAVSSGRLAKVPASMDSIRLCFILLWVVQSGCI